MSHMFDLDFEAGGFCTDRRDDIVLYIFDEMGPGATEAFESHILSCAGCRHEAESLRKTLRFVGESVPPAAAAGAGDASAWEQEWTMLRRRLLSTRIEEAAPIRPIRHAGLRSWLPLAAAVALTAALAFSAGYLWRWQAEPPAGGPSTGADRSAPPISGASGGNYFDNLDDFTRDTHNFLRRTRMFLMEFSNFGADSDPSFFRESATDLLGEVSRYQEVARRMQDRKLGDLLEEIAGILKEISGIDHANQKQVIGEVRATLHITGLVATLELLDAAMERALRVESHA